MSFQHAVAIYIGIDHGRNADVFEAAGDVERGQRRCFRPAFDRDLAVARVQPHRDPAGIGAGGSFDERRIAHGRGADDHTRDALIQPGVDGGAIADAAAELHRDFHRRNDSFHRRGVDRLTSERAVEIDQVQIGEALLRKGARLRRRIAAEHRRARHVALLQTHGLAILQIDRRK